MKTRKHFIFTVSETKVNRDKGGFDYTVTVLEIKSNGNLKLTDSLKLIDSVLQNTLTHRGPTGGAWDIIRVVDKNVEAFCKRTGLNPELYPTESEGRSILVEQV